MTMGTPRPSRHPGRRIESRKAAEKLLEDEVEHAAGKLKEQLNLIGVIMDTVPDVVVTCNENLEIRTVNSACECVIGYRRDELIGECLTEIVPALADHRKVLASDAFVVSDIEVRLPDGETIAAELRGRRTRLYDKPLIVIVLHDMSERNAAKTMKGEIHKQLHESRRLEAIGALSSGIAHELNTPIQFIGDNVKFVGLSLRKIHNSYKHYDELKSRARRGRAAGGSRRDRCVQRLDRTAGPLIGEILVRDPGDRRRHPPGSGHRRADEGIRPSRHRNAAPRRHQCRRAERHDHAAGAGPEMS